MATNQDEPRFALFVAKEPDATDSGASRDVWDKFVKALPGFLTKETTIEILRKGAFLLPLPDTLPILCQYVATAELHKQQYTVRLFGQPLLSYSRSEPPPQDV